jgi:hypothetical protein
MMFQHAEPYVRVLRRHDAVEPKPDDAALKDLRLGQISKFVSTLTQLRPNWTTESPHLRAQTEELLMGVMFDSPLAISAVAQELGMQLSNDQLIKAGAAVARLYRGKHHTEPPKKHRGEERSINAYTEADRELIVAALKQVVLVSDSDV